MEYGKNTIQEFAEHLQDIIQQGTSTSDIVQELSNWQKPLEHHKDTTVGLYAMDFDPCDALHKFWQRISDACPLECSEAEKQQDDFHDWMLNKTWQIEF